MLKNADNGRNGKDPTFARSLSLDLEDETSVTKALIWSRVKIFGSLLSKLQGTIDANGWRDHANILNSVNATFRALTGSLQRLETSGSGTHSLPD